MEVGVLISGVTICFRRTILFQASFKKCPCTRCNSPTVRRAVDNRHVLFLPIPWLLMLPMANNHTLPGYTSVRIRWNQYPLWPSNTDLRSRNTDLKPLTPAASTPIYFTNRTPWPLVHKRSIPTERPPLVDEI
jgi:hypothetical protein